ncbi:MAG: hypothetical protein ACREV8_13585, partial [Gammaproteobacteria bacterium]
MDRRLGKASGKRAFAPGTEQSHFKVVSKDQTRARRAQNSKKLPGTTSISSNSWPLFSPERFALQ